MTTRTITLTMTVTDAEAEALVKRFINTASAVTSTPDDDGEVDANGVPWNEEFHAATKNKNNDGTWKKRKGVDKDALDAYEKKFSSAAPAAPAAPQGDVEVPAFLKRDLAPAAAPAAPAAMPAAAPTMPAMPSMPAMPAMPAAAPAPVTYEQMIDRYVEAQKRVGDVTLQAAVTNHIYPKLGINGPEPLQTNETLRAQMVAELDAL